MNAAQPEPSRLRRTAKRVSRLLLALAVTWVIGMIALRFISLDRLTQLRTGIASWYWPLLAWRLGWYVAFIANYATVTRWFAKRGGWTPQHLERALKGRRFMAGNLVLLEAVISAPHWLSVIGH